MSYTHLTEQEQQDTQADKETAVGLEVERGDNPIGPAESRITGDIITA
ncbi:MAG: hypothetical protein IT446_04095 [Phycisphaerales bacterium]|nr:hypothetical protein [Phycisphaerales bacterium]